MTSPNTSPNAERPPSSPDAQPPLSLKGQGNALLTGVLVLLILTAGAAVRKRLPDPDGLSAGPFFQALTRDQAAQLRVGTVQVLDLNTSPTVLSAPERAVSRNGTFLVLDVQFTARRRPGMLSSLTVEALDGRTFGGRPPVGSDGCGTSQPGIPVRCQVVFEVDRAALEGLKLRVPSDMYSLGSGDDVALIDLQIDAIQAEDLARRTAELTVSSVARLPER